MHLFRATVRIARPDVKLLITDEAGDDRLKAILPSRPYHPRALLTLLEGAALWAGQPLSAAIAAGSRADLSLDAALFGGGIWPDESALVRFDAAPDRPRRRIRGPGDFRQLYLVHQRGRCA